MCLAVLMWSAPADAQASLSLNYVVDASGRWRINGQPPKAIQDFESVSPSMTIEHDETSSASNDSLRLRLNGRLLVVSCARRECTRAVTIPTPLGSLGGSMTVNRARKDADDARMLRRIRHQASLSADFRINDGIVALKDGNGELGPLLETAAPRGIVAVLCKEGTTVCVPQADSAIVVRLQGRSGKVSVATPGVYDVHIFRVRVTTDGERYESTGLRPAVVLAASETRSREIRRELDSLIALVGRWKDPALPKEREALPRRLLLKTDAR